MIFPLHSRRSLLLILLFMFSGACIATPENDRKQYLDIFARNIPGVPVSEYVHGSMMLSQDAREQFNSIMDFPPFQDSLDRGKTIWNRSFSNGKKLEDCFENQGKNIAGNYPYYDEAVERVITFEMAINQCLETNGEMLFD